MKFTVIFNDPEAPSGSGRHYWSAAHVECESDTFMDAVKRFEGAYMTHYDGFLTYEDLGVKSTDSILVYGSN